MAIKRRTVSQLGQTLAKPIGFQTADRRPRGETGRVQLFSQVSVQPEFGAGRTLLGSREAELSGAMRGFGGEAAFAPGEPGIQDFTPTFVNPQFTMAASRAREAQRAEIIGELAALQTGMNEAIMAGDMFLAQQLRTRGQRLQENFQRFQRMQVKRPAAGVNVRGRRARVTRPAFGGGLSRLV